MRRSSPVLAAVLCALAAAPAAADPIPAGRYTAEVTGGQVKLGTLVPAMPVPAQPPVEVTIPADATQVGVPLVNALTFTGTPVPVDLGLGTTGTITPTVTPVGVVLAQLGPATGSGSATAGATGTITGALTTLLGPTTLTCAMGTVASPVTLTLSTAAGKAYDAATGTAQLADRSFVLPALTGDALCSAANLVFSLPSAPGASLVEIDLKLTRLADPLVPGGGGGSGGAGTTAPPSPGTPPAGTPGPSTTGTPSLRGARLALGSKRLRVRGGKVRVPVACAGAQPCSGKVLVRRGTRKLGTKAYRIAGGKRASVAVGLSKAAQRLLRRKRSLPATVVLQPRGGAAKRTAVTLTR